MSSTTPLEPALYAVLPPSLLASTVAHLSLLSVHIENLSIVDRVYVTRNPVIPGQLRYLRYRSVLRPRRPGQGKGQGQGHGRRERQLAYISSPLRGAEYAEASTRALIGLDVQGLEKEDDVQAFIETLGFEHSHSYRLTGHLFYLPLPTSSSLTLHLSVVRLLPLSLTTPLAPADGEAGQGGQASPTEPYLVQLSPSRPVHAVPTPGEAGYQDILGAMRDVVSRVDLEWAATR